MDFSVILQLMIVGVVAGLLAGVFGVGGGLVVVPMLIFLLPQDVINPLWRTHIAVATSLASIVFTGSMSAWRHYLRGGVERHLAAWMSAGVIGGASLGAYLSRHVPTHFLQVLIVVFELFVAFRLLYPSSSPASQHVRYFTGSVHASVAFVIAMISSWLGIGGGSMSVPYMRWLGLEMRQAVATSAVVGVPIALAAAITFMLMNPAQVSLPPYSLGFVYLPALLFIVLGSVSSAPLGVRMAHRLPQLVLQRLFALLLLLFATLLIIKTWL